MDQKKLGNRIRQEREQSGLTQDAAEKALGLAQKALTRIEAGQREVSTLELSKLAALFHLSVADFFDETFPDETPLVALYRLVPGLEKDPKFHDQVARALHICQEGALLEKLLGLPTHQMLLSYPYPCPRNALEAITQGEQAAVEERRRLGIGDFPLYDIVEILTSQGIWVTSTALPKELSGLFLHHPSIGMAILINDNHSPTRQRFSYAHEYAHALFDSKHNVVVSSADNASDLIEKRANAFAAAFLLPSGGVFEKIKKMGKGSASRNSLAIFDVATDSVIDIESRQKASAQRLTPQDVALLAHHFGVSLQAMIYRLHSLRIVSQKEREELLANERAGKKYLQMLHFFEDSEELPKKLPQRELKAYISHLIVEAYQQEKISRGRLQELCKMVDLKSSALLDLIDY